MKVKETANRLLEEISPFFEKWEFKLNKQQREFKRAVGECTQIIAFFFYKKGNYITIKPEIRIQVKSIVNIYKANTSIKGRPYCCLGNHLFEILRYIDEGVEHGFRKKAVADWLVRDEGSINKLIEVIPTYLEETILPYYDQNSSLSRVDEVLNKKPREMSIHNYLYPLRANVAIIAAKLNGNPKYEELIGIYEEELEEAEDTYKGEFYRLKKYLRNYCLD